MSLIMKIVSGKHINPEAVANVIRYIHAGAMKLPEHERLFGCVGFPADSDPESVIQGMMMTKRIFEAEDGVQCKHFVVSFGERPRLSRKKRRKLMMRIAGYWKDQYQIFWGVHHNVTETGENYHIHIMLNSVNMKTGRRINITKKKWKKFVKSANRTWSEAVKHLEQPAER